MPESLDERARDVFDQVIDRVGTERVSHLERACAGAPELRNRVEALLHAAEKDDSFLNGPTLSPTRLAVERSAGEQPGARIGPYALVGLIGDGGFGSVFLAEQSAPVRRQVALKIIKAGMDTQQVIARFEAERQALALMDHPNIARVLEAGATESGRPYFVMELVRGELVTRYCDGQRLSIRQRLELFRDICGAVQHAHQKGIIHRDLKPSNILATSVDGKPMVKVIDFGIAKATAGGSTDPALTQRHELVGTPEYMSPEQADISGVDIDTRSDIYSMGVLLYELLTGSTPFDRYRLAASGFDGMRRILRDEEPLRPSLRLQTLAGSSSRAHSQLVTVQQRPGGDDSSAIEIARRRRTEPAVLTRTLRRDLDWIVLKCLEKDRARRYETASALADDIGRYLDHQPVLATPASAVYKLGKFVRRNRGAVIAGTVVISTMLIATSVSVAFGLGEARQRRAAELDRRRAQKAEGEAQARADELASVAKFQEQQLSGIDAQAMGMRLRADLLERVRAAAEGSQLAPDEVSARLAELERLVAGSDFTGMALEALDDNVFGRALVAIEEQFADQPLVKARLLQTLAATMCELGLLDLASAPQQEALAIRRRVLGDEHADTLNSIHNLGFLLQRQGKLTEAEAHYRDALEKQRRLLGDEHPDTLASVHDMGSLLQAQGKLSEAESYVREALEKRRDVLGAEHPETLASLSNLGALLCAQGKMHEAEPCYRQALESRRRVLGDEHPHTLNSLNGMAMLLEQLGSFPEAETYAREALEKRRRVLGDEHPDTLTSIGNLGGVLRLQGKWSEAEPYYREALEKHRRVLGDEHPNTLRAMNLMSMLLQSQNKLTEAEPLARECLEKQRRVLGDEHPSTISSMSNMAVLLRGRGRLDEAETLYREALERGRRILGSEHPEMLLTLSNLCVLLMAEGKLAEAELCRREVLEIQRRVLGDEHPDTLMSHGNLGMVLYAQGRLSEAEPILREVLEKRRRVLGEEHPDTITSLGNLALLLQVQGKLSEAEPYQRDVLEKRRRRLGDEHVATLGSIINLGSLLIAQDEFEESVQLLAPAESAVRRAFTGGNATHLGRFLMTLGNARIATGDFVASQSNLNEAHEIFSEAKSATERDRTATLRNLIKLYDAWHAAEPDQGHDQSANGWREKLQAWQASTRPANP